MSHLKVRERADRPGTFQITGTVPGYERLRRASKAQTLKLAKEEAAVLEARMLREAFHGKPNGRADRLFAEIAKDYLDFEDRHPAQISRVLAVAEALGNVKASTVTQEVVDRLRATMFKKTNKPARNSIHAYIVMPITCVLNFGWRRGWCDKPLPFEMPKEEKDKRPKILLPSQAWALLDGAAEHLRPMFITMIGIGSRVTETLKLQWEDVDLAAGTATLVQKGRRLRYAQLPPAVVTALANLPLPHTTGPVFYYTKTTDRHARRYAYRSIGPTNSGQIKSGFEATLKRAGLDGLGLTPHCLRHTFASWHYAVWRDPLKLKIEGGWESSQMVERYMHLMPTGQQAEILRFWGYRVDDTKLAPATEAAYLSA